jgi:hypothetical protein
MRSGRGADPNRGLAQTPGVRGFCDRFQALLNVAPPEDVPWVSLMVNHEAAVVRIAQREAEGGGSMEHDLLPMLLYPMARPSGRGGG